MKNDFNVDINIGPAALKTDYGVDKNNLLIHSIFNTVQGEQPFLGVPAIFLRLGGCNRGGKGFSCGIMCDTLFAVSQSKLMDVYSVYLDIRLRLKATRSKLVVITGGEPMMQPALAELCYLLLNTLSTDFMPVARHEQWQDYMCSQPVGDYSVQIESNGDFHQELPFGTDLVISPKAYNSHSLPISPDKFARGERPKIKSAQFLPIKMHRQITAFRFVTTSVEDEPHHSLPKYLLDILRHTHIPLYLSPMTVYKTTPSIAENFWTEDSSINKEETQQNYSYAQTYAAQLSILLNRPVMLSIQSHLFFGIA